MCQRGQRSTAGVRGRPRGDRGEATKTPRCLGQVAPRAGWATAGVATFPANGKGVKRDKHMTAAYVVDTGGAQVPGGGSPIRAEPKEATDTDMEGYRERTPSEVAAWTRTHGARASRRQETVNLGVGLAPLPRKLVERIQAGDFVEFGDFPLVAGNASQDSRNDELVDRLLSIGTGERRKPHKEVPNVLLWISCFTLFRRALLLTEPNRGAELDAYGESILEAARSYQWEFVRNYDKKFRAAAVGDMDKSWAVLDVSLFTKEVTSPHAAFVAANPRASAGLERGNARKRSRPAGAYQEPLARVGDVDPDVCRRYNWQDGRCSFGNKCKYRHICSRCRGQHPAPRCNGPRQEWPGQASRPQEPPSPTRQPRGP